MPLFFLGTFLLGATTGLLGFTTLKLCFPPPPSSSSVAHESMVLMPGYCLWLLYMLVSLTCGTGGSLIRWKGAQGHHWTAKAILLLSLAFDVASLHVLFKPYDRVDMSSVLITLAFVPLASICTWSVVLWWCCSCVASTPTPPLVLAVMRNMFPFRGCKDHELTEIVLTVPFGFGAYACIRFFPSWPLRSVALLLTSFCFEYWMHRFVKNKENIEIRRHDFTSYLISIATGGDSCNGMAWVIPWLPHGWKMRYSWSHGDLAFHNERAGLTRVTLRPPAYPSDAENYVSYWKRYLPFIITPFCVSLWFVSIIFAVAFLLENSLGWRVRPHAVFTKVEQDKGRPIVKAILVFMSCRVLTYPLVLHIFDAQQLKFRAELAGARVKAAQYFGYAGAGASRSGWFSRAIRLQQIVYQLTLIEPSFFLRPYLISACGKAQIPYEAWASTRQLQTRLAKWLHDAQQYRRLLRREPPELFEAERHLDDY